MDFDSTDHLAALNAWRSTPRDRQAVAMSPAISLDPSVRDAVIACPDRGPEGGLGTAGCGGCGGGPELTACSAGKGARPGRVTLRECLACQTEHIHIREKR